MSWRFYTAAGQEKTLDAGDALKAPLASPTFTGTVTLPSGILIPSGAASNYVLTSDASGNASWTNRGVVRNQGTITFTWPGATDLSNSMVIAHGLGATPTVVLCTPNDAVLSVGCTAVDATNITLRAKTVDASIKSLGSFGAGRWWVSI